MSMINIDELHRKQDVKKNKKKEVFEDILKRCHNKIKATAEKQDDCYCFFKIPVYIYGIPLYDLKSCIIYITTALSKNGFDIKYFHPNLIYISWLGKTNKSIQKEQKTFKQPLLTHTKMPNKSVGDYKSIDNYKPSGNFVYNNNSLNLFNNKSNNLF